MAAEVRVRLHPVRDPASPRMVEVDVWWSDEFYRTDESTGWALPTPAFTFWKRPYDSTFLVPFVHWREFAKHQAENQGVPGKPAAIVVEGKW